jgi:hypothetical protein
VVVCSYPFYFPFSLKLHFQFFQCLHVTDCLPVLSDTWIELNCCIFTPCHRISCPWTKVESCPKDSSRDTLMEYTFEIKLSCIFVLSSRCVCRLISGANNKKLNSVPGVRERTIPTERPPLVREVSAKLLRIEGVAWSTHISFNRIFCFLQRILSFSFQVAPQLYSRRWVDHVPDALLLRKYGSAGNRTRTYGSIARKSDQ